MIKLLINFTLFTLWLSAFWGCGNKSPVVAGGGTDVPNSISGTLLDEENQPVGMRPVALARLALNIDPENAIPDKADTTDAQGKFSFQNLTAGKYVLSTPPGGEALSLPRTIIELATDSVVTLNTLALKSKVTLTGTMATPDHLSAESFQILVTGMDLPIEMGEAGAFTISQVPVGPLEIVFILGNLVNTLKLEIEEGATGTLELSPLSFVFFETKSEGNNNDYIEERENSFQILPLELPEESSLHYLITAESGEDIPVTALEDKPGTTYFGEIISGELGFQVQVSLELIFSLDSIEPDFLPEVGQEVMILVVEESITEVELLSEAGLQTTSVE